MTNPSERIERHLIRASGSAILAFAAATVAYTLKGVHWILSHAWGLQTAAFDNVIGVIDWMGGPMDIGFYAFLASEGIQSMVFATLERNEWRRRVEEGERRLEQERAEKEAAEQRIRELEKQLADSNGSRREDDS